MTQFPVPEGAFKSESHWYERTLLAEHVSAILDGIDPSRVLSRDFFIAEVPNQFSGGRWTPADVYDFALTQKPGVAIPRLYPAPDHRGTPGRLLFTQAMEVDPGGQEVAVHVWDPVDDRGHIAIAYPVRDSRGAPPPDTACRLIALLPTATAVVIPDNDPPATSHIRGHRQPTVWVAEKRDADAQRHTWGDVANLLRTPLPWWSFGLRERDAMLAWRPGDKPIAIKPATAQRDPQALHAVLTPDSSTTLRAAVDVMTREIQHDLCGPYQQHLDHDHYRGHHGLQHAATADMDYRTPRPSRTAGQIALFLHQEVANPLAAIHAAQVAGGYPIAHAAYIITTAHQKQPIVKEWLDRLTPSRRRDELGFQLALQSLPPEIQLADQLTPTGYFTDPRNPDSWIVAQNHTVVVTCGTSVPAHGVLEKAYLDAGAAFFIDSHNVAWPMPYPPFPTDPDNHALAQTLTRLILDAGADVADPNSAVETNEELVKRIQTATLPFLIG